MANEKSFLTVQAGDRIDTLSVRAYGDPNKYQLLLDANPELDIFEPHPGMIIEAPDG